MTMVVLRMTRVMLMKASICFLPVVVGTAATVAVNMRARKPPVIFFFIFLTSHSHSSNNFTNLNNYMNICSYITLQYVPNRY